MSSGKEKCDILKCIRKEVDERYGLKYTTSECSHHGDCSGTSPKCGAGLKELQRQLDLRGITNIDLANITIGHIEENDDTCMVGGNVAVSSENKTITDTMDMPIPPFTYNEKRRALYKECQIAGIAFHDLNDVWKELNEGAELL